MKNPVFSEVAIVEGAHKTIYVGGQNAVNEKGEVIGKSDIKKQAEQILKNLESALNSADASLNHIVKWNVYIVAGQNPQPAFEVFQEEIKSFPEPPLITMLFVSALANPDFLMEIDAVAIV